MDEKFEGDIRGNRYHVKLPRSKRIIDATIPVNQSLYFFLQSDFAERQLK